MEISKRESKAVVVLDLAGEIDIYNAGELKSALTELIAGGNNRLLLNMRRVPYIDSTGIGVLFSVLPTLKQTKGSLKLVYISDSIRKVFQLTNLLKFFEIFESEEAAIDAFTENPL